MWIIRVKSKNKNLTIKLDNVQYKLICLLCQLFDKDDLKVDTLTFLWYEYRRQVSEILGEM